MISASTRFLAQPREIRPTRTGYSGILSIGSVTRPEKLAMRLSQGNSGSDLTSNSPFGVVAQPSRLRVRTASRRSKRHGAGTPRELAGGTPALRHNENCCKLRVSANCIQIRRGRGRRINFFWHPFCRINAAAKNCVVHPLSGQSANLACHGFSQGR